jgi:hypothetical protein
VGLANYAETDDIAGYLPKVPTAQQPVWAQLCSVASRGIDRFTDRYFYNDTGTVKYFDVFGDPGPGGSTIRTFRSFKHDFYGATIVKVAQVENADPAVATDWVTLTGDGITPPSDYFLEPGNETYLGKAGDTNTKPYDTIELPRTPARTSSTFQNGFMIGKRTLSLQPAGWGWPAIPDEIKDICCKVVVRMFKAVPTGFTGATGSPDTAAGTIMKWLDINDWNTLMNYRKMSVG